MKMRMMGSVKTTKYEMALCGGNGYIMSLGWTARKTKRALWLAMIVNGPEILKHVNLPADDSEAFVWKSHHKAWVWRNFSIAFNGTTKAR